MRDNVFALKTSENVVYDTYYGDHGSKIFVQIICSSSTSKFWLWWFAAIKNLSETFIDKHRFFDLAPYIKTLFKSELDDEFYRISFFWEPSKLRSRSDRNYIQSRYVHLLSKVILV